MRWFLNNMSLISFIISLVGFGFSIYKFYLERPKLKFYDSHVQPFFKYSDPSEYKYQQSECIAFVYVKIGNPTIQPCTISEFVLNVDGYESTYYRCGTEVRDDYIIDGSLTNGKYTGIRGHNFIKLPVRIEPFGYIEGYIVFPYAPRYEAHDLHMTLIANTPRKSFSYFDTICFRHSNK